MDALKILEYLRKNTILLKKVFFLFLGIIVLVDVFLPREHAHYLVDKVYAFWTIFSLAGCFLLIKVSKGIAHMILAKDEHYYD